jgi:hypothetical protein
MVCVAPALSAHSPWDIHQSVISTRSPIAAAASWFAQPHLLLEGTLTTSNIDSIDGLECLRWTLVGSTTGRGESSCWWEKVLDGNG